jgi:hypothetical protein
MLFHSIIAGIFLLCVSVLFTTIVAKQFPNFTHEISNFSPISIPFFFTAIGSFFLGYVLAVLFNRFISYDKAVAFAIRKIGNEFEVLLLSSWQSPHLIQMTLKNNKVYVGWLKTLPAPGETAYVSILPVLSGYRESETKKLHFTTEYLDVYASYVKDGDATDVNDLTNLVIKVDDIITASEFDIDMYDRFLEQETGSSKASHIPG